jgi:hypothetical protein
MAQYGQECWADHYLSANGKTASAASSCAMPCTGDKQSVCGDRSLLTMYRNPSWTPPVVANPGVGGAKFAGCYTCVVPPSLSLADS